MKKVVALVIALVSAFSLATVEVTNISAITNENQEIIDLYHESKKNLLIGNGDNNISILDVLSNKKAVLEASKTTIDTTSKETTVTVTESTVTTTEPINTTTDESTTYIATTTEPEVVISSSTVMYKGIDVSSWQGTINWQKVKDSGIDFAIIRAGYTSSSGAKCKDPYFEFNYQKCKEYGIDVGCYYFTRARNVTQAQDEADYLISIITGKQFEYPICFDIESESLTDLSRTTLTNNTIAFCDRMESNGYYTSIYANPYWFDSILIKSSLTKYDKWLAHWTNSPKYGSDFGGLWQYGLGTCLGITGQCDVDYSYKNYPYIIKKAGLNGF